MQYMLPDLWPVIPARGIVVPFMFNPVKYIKWGTFHCTISRCYGTVECMNKLLDAIHASRPVATVNNL